MLNKKLKKIYSILIAIACLLAAIIMYKGVIKMLYSTSRYNTAFGFGLFLLGLYILFTKNVEKIIKRFIGK